MRALYVIVLIAGACAPMPVVPSPAPMLVSAPSLSPSPSLSRPDPIPVPSARLPATPDLQPPSAAARVPDVGVLVTRDAFGALYRYDGAGGRVDRLTDLSSWTIVRQTDGGLYEAGLQGGAIFVPWSGPPRIVPCSVFLVAISASGACAGLLYGPGGGFAVQNPISARPVVLFPPDWGAGATSWDPTSLRFAVTRTVDTRCNRCPNALYVIGRDGTPHLLYDTRIDANHTDPRGAVARMAWSPRGDLIATSFATGCAGCDHTGGFGLMLIDPESSRTVDMGRTTSIAADVTWSSRGDLAFVSGTEAQRSDSVLRVRLRDGTGRAIDDRGARPVWSADGARLAWVRDGMGEILDMTNGVTRTVRCAAGDVKGVQLARDDDSILLFCRLTDPELDRFVVRYLDGAIDQVVLEHIGGGIHSTFDPDFLDLVAWSKGSPRL